MTDGKYRIKKKIIYADNAEGDALEIMYPANACIAPNCMRSNVPCGEYTAGVRRPVDI